MAAKNSDLPVRIFGSVFVVAAILGGIWLGNPFWSELCAFAALLSLWEFYKLTAADHKYSPVLMFLLAAATFYAVLVKHETGWILVFASVCVIVLLFDEVWDRQRTGKSGALRSIGNFIGGVAYVILPWCYLALLRDLPFGQALLVVIFFCTWSCDVFAYFTGRCFGKHKLCEKVSPKKTLEGTLGGAVACVLCALIGALVFTLPLLHTLALGIFCGVLGQIGDLAESVLKREANVKDSGNIIPGHGGMLDRFDSILVNAVVAYIIFGLFVL